MFNLRNALQNLLGFAVCKAPVRQQKHGLMVYVSGHGRGFRLQVNPRMLSLPAIDYFLTGLRHEFLQGFLELFPDNFIPAMFIKPDNGGSFGLVKQVVVQLNAVINTVFNFFRDPAEYHG